MRRLLPLLAAARLLSSSGVASAAPCAAKAASRAAASARFGAYASDGPYPVGTATVANLRRSFGNWSWSPVKKLLAALVDPIPGLSPPEYPTFNALLTYPASPSAAAAGDDESSVEFAAPLEGDAPRFALLGFMPGWSCNAQLYAPLFRRLASHGGALSIALAARTFLFYFSDSVALQSLLWPRCSTTIYPTRSHPSRRGTSPTRSTSSCHPCEPCVPHPSFLTAVARSCNGIDALLLPALRPGGGCVASLRRQLAPGLVRPLRRRRLRAAGGRADGARRRRRYRDHDARGVDQHRLVPLADILPFSHHRAHFFPGRSERSGRTCGAERQPAVAPACVCARSVRGACGWLALLPGLEAAGAVRQARGRTGLGGHISRARVRPLCLSSHNVFIRSIAKRLTSSAPQHRPALQRRRPGRVRGQLRLRAG